MKTNSILNVILQFLEGKSPARREMLWKTTQIYFQIAERFNFVQTYAVYEIRLKSISSSTFDVTIPLWPFVESFLTFAGKRSMLLFQLVRWCLPVKTFCNIEALRNILHELESIEIDIRALFLERFLHNFHSDFLFYVSLITVLFLLTNQPFFDLLIRKWTLSDMFLCWTFLSLASLFFQFFR